MRARVLALGSVLAITAGLVGSSSTGCKSDEDTATTSTDAGRDVRTSNDDSGGSTGTCPAAVVASLLTWKAPTKTQENACQDDDLDAMRDFLAKNPNATNEDFANFVKNRDTRCYDCMFADSKGPTWSPLPLEDGKVLTLNIGACYALVSGKESCGKAIQNEFDCEYLACADCTSTQDLDTCRKKARTTVCAAIDAMSRTECAGVPSSVEDACGSVFDSVRVQCISLTAPKPDGGTDGGGGDGGDGGDGG